MKKSMPLLLILLMAAAGCNSFPRIENPRYDTWDAAWDTYKRALKAGDAATIAECLAGKMLKQFNTQRQITDGRAFRQRIIEQNRHVNFTKEKISQKGQFFVNLAVVVERLAGDPLKVMFMLQRKDAGWKIAIRQDMGTITGKRKKNEQ
jgi:hypothetical protein